MEDDVSQQQVSIGLRNARKERINVYLEPWGEVHVLEPGNWVRLDATGPAVTPSSNLLEIHSGDDDITVWASNGCGITVCRP
jgi:hypothetical protein